MASASHGPIAMSSGMRSVSPAHDRHRSGRLSPLRQRPKSVALSLGDLGTDFSASQLIEADVSIGAMQLDFLQPVSVTAGVAPPSINMLFPKPPRGSDLSGLSVLQNQKSEPALRSLFSAELSTRHADSSSGPGPTSFRPASVAKSKRRSDKEMNALRSTDSYDSLLNSLVSKKMLEPVAAPAVVVEKAAPKRAQRIVRDDDEERATSGSIQKRLEAQLDRMRYTPGEMENLAARVNSYALERQGSKHKSPSQRKNFITMNRRPLSPEMRFGRISAVAAKEREKIDRALATKTHLVEQDMLQKIAQRDRREIKKAAEARAKKERRQHHHNSQLLLLIAVASRAYAFCDAVVVGRQNKAKASDEDVAARTISTAMRIWKWNKDNKEKRKQRVMAAERIQKTYRVHAFYQRLLRRRQCANEIKSFLQLTTREGQFQTLIKQYRFKIFRIQRFWRNVLAMRKAQLGLLLRLWDQTRLNYRADLKRIEKELKVLRDKPKKKPKAGKPPQPDPERIALEDELKALPRFQDKVVTTDIQEEIMRAWMRETSLAYKAKKKIFLEKMAIYTAEMARLATIIEVRRAMGATQRDEMPTRPIAPVTRFLPIGTELVALIREGEHIMQTRKKGKRTKA
eukprot:SAG31_NODE_2829_length_5028_cov_2.496652_2_plen_627_part_00